ncbi:MAG: VanZ family protein [Bryobacterales bacterium]|nr:VanZ family protein [Bryobacterales bacterium]
MRHLNPATKFFLGYVAFILYLCLFPWTATKNVPGPWFTWVWVGGRTGIADLVLNFAFYIPFGFLGSLAFPRIRQQHLKLVFAGALLSILIEYLQGWLPGRVSSVMDVFANTAGAGCGALMAPWVFRVIRRRVSRFCSLSLSVPVLILLGIFAAGQAFPFNPQYRLPHLRAVLAAFAQPSDPQHCLFLGALFMATAYWLRFVTAPSMPASLRIFLLVAFLASRPFLPGQPFTGGEWAAVFTGSVVGTFLPAAVLERILCVLLPLLLLMEELRPFRFSPEPSAFVWAPFRAFFDISPLMTIRYFAGKLFFYGITIAAPTRCGVSLTISAVSVISILGAGEIVQRYLPGRTPESTDLFLALAAWGMWRLGDPSRRHRAAPTQS